MCEFVYVQGVKSVDQQSYMFYACINARSKVTQNWLRYFLDFKYEISWKMELDCKYKRENCICWRYLNVLLVYMTFLVQFKRTFTKKMRSNRLHAGKVPLENGKNVIYFVLTSYTPRACTNGSCVEFHIGLEQRFFSRFVMKVLYGTLRIKRSTQCLEFKLLLITAKNSSVSVCLFN